jgi:hypothetical protein
MQITVISIQLGAGEAQLGQLFGLGEGLAVVQRAGIGSDQADAEDEAEVAHAVDQEGLHVGEDGGRPVEPEADQQIRHQAHGFPAEEQLQHVVAHDEHQHGEGEQRDVREEAVVALVFVHVADGVDVHHQRHEGHDAHHHRGEAVDQEADLHLQAADHHPGVEGFVEARTVHGHASSVMAEMMKAINTPRMVRLCVTFRLMTSPPNLVPSTPAMMEPASGAIGTARRVAAERV